MLNTVSITDLKQNTAKIVEQVNSSGKSVVVLQRSKPAAVILDPIEYEALISKLEDL